MFHSDEYVQLSKSVLKAVCAEKIFLLGSTNADRRTQNIFTSAPVQKTSVEHYYILVLVLRNRENSNTTLQEKIESMCASFTSVTAFVADFEQFNEWLLKGHLFASRVYSNAVCLFDNLSTKLNEPGIIDREAVKNENEIIFCQGINKVQEFLAGADLYRIRKQNQLTAFMLHQATEHALLTILQLHTGLSVTTHNLDKLLRFCSLVSSNVADIFRRHIAEDNRMFQLLQKAYIESRYRSTYQITQTDLLNLTDKIRRLQTLVQNEKKSVFI
ncbi:MAG: HEPN domain-containing protein [Chitinophagaceae bacterium]|nr:HEPN domain-containing protein [Chitinophagaceae bacterium]